VEVPVIAGPYDLGEVTVGADIFVSSDGSVTATSDAFPSIVRGVPVRLRRLALHIDRPGFMLNPTSCNPMSLDATVTAAQGQTTAASSPFQVADCGALRFAPHLTAATLAHTSRLDGASLRVDVKAPPGGANIHSVDVQMPPSLPARQSTLRQACTEAQFAAAPAGCPRAAQIGTASATTPLLAHPLTGTAYLVSRGGAAFPDLVAVLRGEGITIDLRGSTQIKKGITYARFESLPDAPVSSFELTLPQGPDSLLGAYGSLCKRAQSMPTTIGAQSGAAIRQATRIRVAGCPRRRVAGR
jgi:hypothetical protein